MKCLIILLYLAMVCAKAKCVRNLGARTLNARQKMSETQIRAKMSRVKVFRRKTKNVPKNSSVATHGVISPLPILLYLRLYWLTDQRYREEICSYTGSKQSSIRILCIENSGQDISKYEAEIQNKFGPRNQENHTAASSLN